MVYDECIRQTVCDTAIQRLVDGDRRESTVQLWRAAEEPVLSQDAQESAGVQLWESRRLAGHDERLMDTHSKVLHFKQPPEHAPVGHLYVALLVKLS